MDRYLPNALVFLSLILATAGCDEKPKQSTEPTPSATVHKAPEAASANSPTAKPLPPLELQTFRGLGLTFRYPAPYTAETATSNPELHQIAVDHNKEPGVLTIRFNPKNPGEILKLDEIGEATRQRMDPKATVAPSSLLVAGKSYEARTIKSSQLGLVAATDVVAIVPIEGTNYIVLTHVSDDDGKRAQRMFDTVLGSLAKE
ncbi:MAG: hypothetical protein U1E22_09710 [Coriobacteriia bacterium]|nr:hypothetical protein [Coriobacteriia bacterium]